MRRRMLMHDDMVHKFCKATVIVAMILVAGCTRYVATDLEVVSVDAVNWREQQEVRDFAPFEPALSAPGVSAIVSAGSWHPREKADTLVLRVRWKTSTNLIASMQSDGVRFFVLSALCEDIKDNLTIWREKISIGPMAIYNKFG